jgi:ketosteroid isomerase-like protein
MIAAGVNAKALSVFMGHATVSITLDLYGHLFPGAEDEAAGMLDAFLARQVGGGGARGGRAVAGIDNVVGRDDYLEMLRKFGEGFKDLSVEAEQIVDAGDDRVVAITRAFGTGKRSGAPVEMRLAYVHWLEERRVVRVDPYLEPNDALKAVGMRE